MFYEIFPYFLQLFSLLGNNSLKCGDEYKPILFHNNVVAHTHTHTERENPSLLVGYRVRSCATVRQLAIVEVTLKVNQGHEKWRHSVQQAT